MTKSIFLDNSKIDLEIHFSEIGMDSARDYGDLGEPTKFELDYFKILSFESEFTLEELNKKTYKYILENWDDLINEYFL